MQHNWWIAALEHIGVLTREQAEELSTKLKGSIHRERYTEAFDEISYILGEKTLNKVKNLESDVVKVKDHIATLSKPATEVKAEALAKVKKV